MGSYGEDWLEMQNRDHQQTGVNRVDGYSDFMLSSRISYEMDLKGPTYVPCLSNFTDWDIDSRIV